MATSLLKQYEFNDAGSPAASHLLPGHHWNANQSPAMEGQYASIGWVYDGAGGANVDSDLLTTFRFNFYPGTEDVDVRLFCVFPTVAGVNRNVDLFARMTDADKGYFVRLSTNFGSPRLRLYRMEAGVETALAAAVSVSVTQDVPTDLRIVCAGNVVTAYLDDVQKSQVTEADADVLMGNERVGFASTLGTLPNGPTVSDLRIYDTVDLADKDGAYLLQVDDEALDADEMAEAGISIERVTLTHFGASGLTVHVKELHTDPRWSPEARVTLKAWISGAWVVVFRGRIRDRNRIGRPPSEVVEYFVAGPEAMAKYVVPEHPDSEASTIVWNALPEEDGYDADFAGKTVGEILLWYFEENRDELAHHGAIDPNPASTPTVQADLDALDVEPTRIDLTGDFEEVVMSLLSLVPNVARFVEPDTWQWRFVNPRDFSPATDVEFEEDGRSVTLEVNDETADLYTAVLVKSVVEEIKELDISTANGGLARIWDRSLDRYYTKAKEKRTAITGVVKSLVDDGQANGQPVVAVDAEMWPGEWAGGVLGIAAKGSITDVPIITNTQTQVTLQLVGGFPTGSPAQSPAADDACTIEDSRANSAATDPNGFSKVHRWFQVADPDKRDLLKHSCATMHQENQSPGGGETRQTAHQLKFEATPGVIVTGAPLIFFFEDQNEQGRCETPGDYRAADARFQGKYKSVTVRKLRIPTTGYRGTAYSDTVAKWNGGGDAVAPDWRIARVKLIENQDWRDDTQDAGVEAAAEAWLEAHMHKPYEGEVVLTGIDWTWRKLQKAITFSSVDPLRDSDTGDLGTDYIYPFEVTYLPRANQTILTLGDRGEFAREFQDLMANKSAQSALDALTRRTRRLEEVQECFEQSHEVKAHGTDDNPICSTQVRGNFKPRPGGGRPPSGVKGKLDEVQDALGFLHWVIFSQKEMGEVPDDPNWPVPDPSDPGTPAPGTVYTSKGSVELWKRRPGGTLQDELVKLEASAGNAKVPKVGPDRGHVITGRGEPNLAAFHHRHEEDEKTNWNGSEVDLTLSFTPVSGRPVLVLHEEASPERLADFYDAIGAVNILGTPVTVTPGNTRRNLGGFTLSGGEVTVPIAGDYSIHGDVGAEYAGAGSEATAEVFLERYTASAWSEITGTRATVLARSGGVNGSAHMAATLTLAASDKIRLRAVIVAGSSGDMATQANTSRILLRLQGKGSGVHALKEVSSSPATGEYLVSGRTVTFGAAPAANSETRVIYSTQGDVVRRSETFHAEAGTIVESAEVTFHAEAI